MGQSPCVGRLGCTRNFSISSDIDKGRRTFPSRPYDTRNRFFRKQENMKIIKGHLHDVE